MRGWIKRPHYRSVEFAETRRLIVADVVAAAAAAPGESLLLNALRLVASRRNNCRQRNRNR